MKISTIIVSYRSEHLIEAVLNKIPKSFQVVIVENSCLKNVKQKIEKKYKNVEVIIPSKNLGYASAINLAYRKCKNNFVLIITPDVKFNTNLILKLTKLIKSFQDFTLLAPVYKNDKIHKNYQKNSKNLIINFKGYNLLQVKDIDGCFCIINKSKIKSQKILDENFFLYFEFMDFCLNLLVKKHKFYVVKNLTFDHMGTSSSKTKFKSDIILNRNWHYSWSKFYFFKKNYNYIFALKKIIPNIYQGVLGAIISVFKLNFLHIKLHLASVKGAFNSIFLRKSNFRIKFR